GQVGRLGSGRLVELVAIVALIAAYVLLARTVLREWLLPPAGVPVGRTGRRR
ncbi:hypothetical protein G5C51_41395, partial [Streptomyces sp. A7024]|nr:hypothetical protein [Streptomyces coryli]